jgi:hypothetical protein
MTPRRGPHRKSRSSIVARVFVSAGTCLPSRCLETGCITPLFYCCVLVCCRRYLATAAVYSYRLVTGLYATLLFSRHKSGINTLCVRMYYMFRPIAAIIRYTALTITPIYICDTYPLEVRCTCTLFM